MLMCHESKFEETSPFAQQYPSREELMIGVSVKIINYILD